MGNKKKTVIKSQAATAVALSWVISVADSFDIERIDIHLDAAPTTAENLTVTRASNSQVLRTVSMVGKTDVTLENLLGFAAGDSVTVAYANTDTNTITGDANVTF